MGGEPNSPTIQKMSDKTTFFTFYIIPYISFLFYEIALATYTAAVSLLSTMLLPIL